MGNTYKPDHRQRIQCSVGKFLEYKTDATATAFPQEISLSLRANTKNQRIGAPEKEKEPLGIQTAGLLWLAVPPRALRSVR